MYWVRYNSNEDCESFDDLDGAVRFIVDCKSVFGDNWSYELFHVVNQKRQDVVIDGVKYTTVTNPFVKVFIKGV